MMMATTDYGCCVLKLVTSITGGSGPSVFSFLLFHGSWASINRSASRRWGDLSIGGRAALRESS